MAQIRDGILVADLASDNATRANHQNQLPRPPGKAGS